MFVKLDDFENPLQGQVSIAQIFTIGDILTNNLY